MYHATWNASHYPSENHAPMSMAPTDRGLRSLRRTNLREEAVEVLRAAILGPLFVDLLALPIANAPKRMHFVAYPASCRFKKTRSS